MNAIIADSPHPLLLWSRYQRVSALFVLQRIMNPPVDRSSKIGAAFLIVFAIPFALAGLWALLNGITRIIHGGPREAWILVLVGIVMSLVGFGLIAGVIFGSRKLKQDAFVQAENPGQPWMWRADWAQGRSVSRTRTTTTAAWVFAVLWNLVSLPIFFFVPFENFRQQPGLLIALLFPAIGIGLLIRAVRQTLRLIEFGENSFRMASLPCVVGREMRGTIETRLPHLPDHGLSLKLTCVHRTVSGSGNSRTVNEKIIFRDEKIIASSQLCLGPSGTVIPVSFHIPSDSLPTDSSNSQNTIQWLLEADASVPGVDYQDIFEIPVFRTKDSPAAGETDSSTEPETVTSAPETPTVLVRPAAQGGTEYYFPAGRNRGFAASLSGFTVLWSACCALIFYMQAPLIFPIVFGAFDLLLIYFSLQLCFKTSSVTIVSGAVTLRTSLLGFASSRQVTFSDIAYIQARITAQQGGSTGTPYYDLQLVRKDGPTITLGSALADKHEAEWLVADMSRLVGLRTARAASAATV